MVKKFKLENDVGIEIKYTVLGITEVDGHKMVVYTDYFPSDNELGIRLIAGELISEDPFEIKKLRKSEQKDIIEDFKIEFISSGSKLRKKST